MGVEEHQQRRVTRINVKARDMELKQDDRRACYRHITRQLATYDGKEIQTGQPSD